MNERPVWSGRFFVLSQPTGVLLLMFIAGLETDLDQFRKNWKSAISVAVGGIILPFFGGYAVAEAFGFAQNYALFMGVVFSATSVSISVQVLKEMDRLSSREGTTILGAAVVDDVLVVILLAVMMSFLGTGTDVSLGVLIGKKFIFFAGVIFIGWLVIPRILKRLSTLQVTEPVVSMALVVCFAFSYFADLMGIAGIIGAFAAGIALSQTEFKDTVEAKIEPIAYSIFVPVFFVSIGLNVTFKGVGTQMGFLAALTIAAILTKFIGAGLGARLTGFKTTSSLAIGSGMISRGEVALIMASTGLQAGLLLPEYFTSVVIMVIITTLVAPPLLKVFFNKNTNGYWEIKKG
ncbi:cation:proton antiporter [Paenibacillus sp. XY044]|uniref:cation:proton antiporter n=1 Tax=Paenibacillus sp. XY044 TaxID=2026089 RepID=UPI000B97E2A1|nr:cation:proton antiporter [Paenibacillus sp. XY044]OZB96861.1 sodium:proton antiporter [Paenibacillus sp. XY044]